MKKLFSKTKKISERMATVLHFCKSNVWPNRRQLDSLINFSI